MRRLARTSITVLALIGCTLSAEAGISLRLDTEPEWRSADSVSDLAEILDVWIDENTEFTRSDDPVSIRMVTPAFVTTMAGRHGRTHGRTRGLFDPDTSTIYLVTPWNPKDAHDASVLLHELIHARQTKRHYYCPGAQEEAAYRLQDAWLAERGLTARVNWIAVMLEAGCTPRDIHPD